MERFQQPARNWIVFLGGLTLPFLCLWGAPMYVWNDPPPHTHTHTHHGGETGMATAVRLIQSGNKTLADSEGMKI